MIRLLFIFSLCVVILPMMAQEQSAARDGSPINNYIDKDGRFSFLLDGKTVSLPCAWKDMEKNGWQFVDDEDANEVMDATRHILLLDNTSVLILTPANQTLCLYFCNLTDSIITRQEAVVYGISCVPQEKPYNIFNVELPGGIRGGISQKSDAEKIYGKPSYANGYSDLWFSRYQAEDTDNEFSVCASDKTDNSKLSKGLVLGFVAKLNREVGRKIINDTTLSNDDINNIIMMREARVTIDKYLKRLWALEADTSATAQNIADTQYVISMSYFTLADTVKAFNWMLLSAHGGDYLAQYNTAVCYQQGLGVKQSYSEARAWFLKAAEQDHAKSMLCIGNLYNEGLGVEQSGIEAVKWWIKAAQNGWKYSNGLLGDIYRDATHGMKQDYEKAAYWYQKYADAGFAEGVYCLACLYFDGKGVGKDYKKAFEMWKSIENAESELMRNVTQHSLGACYYEGKGVEKNIPQALIHFTNFVNAYDGVNLNEAIEFDLSRESVAKELKDTRKILAKHKNIKE